MNFGLTTAIAFGVAMDAFAVSVADGTRPSAHKAADCVKTALAFGLMQSIMTLIGYLLGGALWLRTAGFIGRWTATAILMALGLKMLSDGFMEPAQGMRIYPAAHRLLTLMAESVAVSMDAFAVGIGLAALTDGIIGPVLYIGVVAALLGGIGFAIGHFVGGKLFMAPEILGGAVLIGIALHMVWQLLLWR